MMDTDEFPPGWVMTTLGEVVDCSKAKAEPGERDDAPYLGLEHIESGTCRILGQGVGSEVRSVKNVFQAGDILYGKLRPYLNKVCRPAFDGICSTDVLVLKPTDAIEPGYLQKLLTTQPVVEHAVANSNGINLPRTSFEGLSTFKLALPPLNEQRRIVARIEELQARSRKAREALAAVPTLLEQFRQSVLASAFRGDLTASWREQHPDTEPASALLARIRDERRRQWQQKHPGKKYVEPEPVDTSDLPDLPAQWAYSSAEEIVAPGTVISYGIVLPGKNVSEGVRYIRGQDIEDGCVLVDQLWRTTPEIAAKHERSSLQAGDVLLCIIRHLKVAIVPEGLDGANLTQGTVRLRPSEATTAQFLAGFLASPTAQGWMKARYFGMAMPRINVEDARAIPIPVCPLAEQQEIVRQLSVWEQRFQQVRSEVERSQEDQDRLTQAILAQAFRGELVEQDPTDEPASVLLERIRAERATEPPRRRSRRKDIP